VKIKQKLGGLDGENLVFGSQPLACYLLLPRYSVKLCCCMHGVKEERRTQIKEFAPEASLDKCQNTIFIF
jgi:hypothetical protein